MGRWRLQNAEVQSVPYHPTACAQGTHVRLTLSATNSACEQVTSAARESPPLPVQPDDGILLVVPGQMPALGGGLNAAQGNLSTRKVELRAGS